MGMWDAQRRGIYPTVVVVSVACSSCRKRTSRGTFLVALCSLCHGYVTTVTHCIFFFFICLFTTPHSASALLGTSTVLFDRQRDSRQLRPRSRYHGPWWYYLHTSTIYCSHTNTCSDSPWAEPPPKTHQTPGDNHHHRMQPE